MRVKIYLSRRFRAHRIAENFKIVRIFRKTVDMRQRFIRRFAVRKSVPPMFGNVHVIPLLQKIIGKFAPLFRRFRKPVRNNRRFLSRFRPAVAARGVFYVMQQIAVVARKIAVVTARVQVRQHRFFHPARIIRFGNVCPLFAHSPLSSADDCAAISSADSDSALSLFLFAATMVSITCFSL